MRVSGIRLLKIEDWGIQYWGIECIQFIQYYWGTEGFGNWRIVGFDDLRNRELVDWEIFRDSVCIKL